MTTNPRSRTFANAATARPPAAYKFLSQRRTGARRIAWQALALLVWNVAGCARGGAVQDTPGTTRLDSTVPEPAGSSSLCEIEQRLASSAVRGVCSKIRFLGSGRFADVGLVSPAADIASGISRGADGIGELVGRRAFWEYDGFIITMAKAEPTEQTRVLYTAAALDRIRQQSPTIYAAMIESRSFPITSPLGLWRNRYRSIVISFDKTPAHIAAQTVIIDPSPQSRDGIMWYENMAIISIDEETITGRNPGSGSRPIYNRPQSEDNYRLYMTDGLLYSIGHEFLHTYFDRRNSVSQLAMTVRGNRNTTAGQNAEEVLVAHTTLEQMGDLVSAEVRADVARRVTAILAMPDARMKLGDICPLASAESGTGLRYSCPALN